MLKSLGESPTWAFPFIFRGGYILYYEKTKGGDIYDEVKQGNGWKDCKG